jgi:hypothetical protein
MENGYKTLCPCNAAYPEQLSRSNFRLLFCFLLHTPSVLNALFRQIASNGGLHSITRWPALKIKQETTCKHTLWAAFPAIYATLPAVTAQDSSVDGATSIVSVFETISAAGWREDCQAISRIH